jgi:tellurite resistance protein TerA
MIIQKGQRMPLSAITENRQQIEVGVRIDGVATDIALFGVDSKDQLSDDRYMVFYNQTRSPCGCIEMRAPGQDQGGFRIRPLEIPNLIERLVVVASVDEGRMSSMTSGYLRILDGETEKAKFSFSGSDFGDERAIMLGEFYRKDGGWRFSATAQGFNGGLDTLVKHFGGQLADEKPKQPPQPTPPPAPKINLSKVTLKKNESISLAKKGDGFGEISVNLNWNKTGRNAGVDLDLGCLYELSDGQKGGVQALGNAFGRYQSEPFIQLMGDDRTGASSEGENLRINGQKWSMLKRVMVFAFIYEGAPRWSSTDAVVTIKAPGQPDIIVALDEHSSSNGFCVVAMIENVRGDVRITKHITFHEGHGSADRAYKFGLKYKAGTKE